MHCVPFSGLADTDPNAGGKARSLGFLSRGGFPVPSGFVVLDTAFPFAEILKHFSRDEETDLVSLSDNLMSNARQFGMKSGVAEEIARAVEKLSGTTFAVRSSANVEDGSERAWAGIFETVLSCRRSEVFDAVIRCWLSLYSVRAIGYASEHRFDISQARMAVVIQEMIASDVAGTAFSRHPVTHDTGVIVIESAFGLGEAVVSGSVTPDRFICRKGTGEMVETSIASKEKMLFRNEAGDNEWKYLMRSQAKKPSLTATQASALSEIIARIESAYGFPVDVEWAFADGKWFVLQARPVTA